MNTKQIKIKFIEDCPEVTLTLWSLKNEISKDDSFLFTDSIEDADIVVASRHYHIQAELDKIKSKKLVWINYGASLKSATNLPLIDTGRWYTYNASDKLLALISPSPNYKKVLEDWKLDTSSVKFLGYPKMDLINCSYGLTLEKLGFNPNWKTVLYTPTLGWSIDTCQSSFFDYTNMLVSQALEYNFNLIIRPHPYLKKEFPEIINKLNNIGKLNNIYIDYSYNYYAIFKLVDFIISDISSLAYEFLCTTKPVILTCTSLKEDKLFQQYIDYNIMYKVVNKLELENRIKLLLANYDEFKNRRKTFVNCLPKNPSKLIKNYIKENFK